jgi:ArsR family transcriptional regulator
MITPDSLFGIFSDSTRLRALMLIQSEGEACVCELTFALQESQPKISRHLALMRDVGIVESRREGTWMHYRISPSLPEWSREIIGQVHARLKMLSPYREDKKQLTQMGNRPERSCV